MYPDRSSSTARNHVHILRIRENKSCQIGHAVTVMQCVRSACACISRTEVRFLEVARCCGGRNIHLHDRGRDCLVAFRCQCKRVKDIKGISNRQIGWELWLHTVDAPGCFAEAVNSVWASILGCEDNFAACQRVELGLESDGMG